MGAASAILIVLITLICKHLDIWKYSDEVYALTYLQSPLPVFGLLPAVAWVGHRSLASANMLLTVLDLFINICLTILGYIPGHIHAFYLEYIYYDRREQANEGRYPTSRAPGVYSDNVQTGGQGYGTVNHA